MGLAKIMRAASCHVPEKPWHSLCHTLSAVGDLCSKLVSAVAQVGHGGMLAILPPDESPGPLAEACNYLVEPVDLGDAFVNAVEGGWSAADVEQEIMGPGPDYLPPSALSAAELRQESDLRAAEAKHSTHVHSLSGMAAVDGAVLLTADLKVMGFGCKLPGFDSSLRVLKPSADQQAAPTVYDLTQRGTRHVAAARFAADHRGGLAFTISADGHAGCFMWSKRNDAVMYWPIHAGL